MPGIKKTYTKVSIHKQKSDFDYLARFKCELDLKDLRESADLYTELYEGDSELQELTETALDRWPE